MTLRIGPSDEIGMFFDTMADVGAVYSPTPTQGGYYARQPARYLPPPPMPQYPPQYPPSYPPGVIPAQRLIPSVPGVPAVGSKLQPLGFNAVTFTSASGTALTATTRPQKPFKGKRLVIELSRTGATATGLVLVNSITVGVQNQLVSTGAVSAGAFAGQNQDCNVELSACSTALDISVNYSITTAPGVGDSVAVGTTLFGETVGS